MNLKTDRLLEDFINHRDQICFAHVGICGLDLLGRQFQDMCPYRLFNAARQITFSASALTGQKHAKSLVSVGRDNDIPASCVHGAPSVCVYVFIRHYSNAMAGK